MSILFEKIAESVETGEEENTVKLTRYAIGEGWDPVSIIQKGFRVGVENASRKYLECIYYIPELMLMAEAAKAGLAILLPEIEQDRKLKFFGKVLMGTVEADVHELGKKICLTFLLANSFSVIDAGVDTSAKRFVDLIKIHQPDIVGIGSYMSTTLSMMKKTIDAIRSTGFAGKVVVGGVAVSKTWADEAGADGYAEDAWSCVNLCKSIMGIEEPTMAQGHTSKRASPVGKSIKGVKKTNDSDKL